MRIKTENLKWVIIVGIPIMVVSLLAFVAWFICWEWLEDNCEAWVEEMWGKDK